jgi:hypothetical protein
VALTGFNDDGLGPRRATVVAGDDEAPAALCEALGIPLQQPAVGTP